MPTLKTAFFIACCCLAFNSISAQVGINTILPLSTLDINGNLSVKVVNLNGSATPTQINDGIYISLNPLATDQIFNLPNPTAYPGRTYVLRNVNNTFTAALTTSAGLLFPKGSTTGSATIYMYENNNRTLFVMSDGFNWTYFN
jgi:hypothetical protein